MSVLFSLLEFLGLKRRPLSPRQSPVEFSFLTHNIERSVLVEALESLDATAPSMIGAFHHLLPDRWIPYSERLGIVGRAMDAVPESAWVFCFDGNGYARANAIRRLTLPPQSPGRLLALLLRLNDWVPDVRQAAEEKAQELLPQTRPELIADASEYLLALRFKGGRWKPEGALIDTAISRPDVVDRLVEKYMATTRDGHGRDLRFLLRYPAFDDHLRPLAERAKSGPVRAVAYRALLTGAASWPVGYDRFWVDRVFNLSRRIVRMETRTLPATDLNPLLHQAVRDSSVAVRRAAADALVANPAAFLDVEALAVHLSKDRNSTVRSRADFVLQRLRDEAVS